MERIIVKKFKASIYLLVFLLPLFWLPFSFEAFEFNKQYLFFFLTTAATLFWLFKMVIIDKEVKFKKTPLDLPVIVFLLITIFSAIFSADQASSIFGFYGRFSSGLINLISCVLLYFLITNNVVIKKDGAKEEEKKIKNKKTPPLLTIQLGTILALLRWSGFFIVISSYLSVFGFWQKINTLLGESVKLPAILMQRTFNPVSGSLEGLAIFLSIFVVFLTGTKLFEEKTSVVKRIRFWILFFASLILLILIDFTAAWVILLVSLFLFLVLALWKRIMKENVNKLLIPIFLIVISALFVFINISGLQKTILGGDLLKEQTLGQRISWTVSFNGAMESIKSGFIGSGIGSWHYEFSKFKPESFNNTSFWQIRFDKPGNHISELLGTIGFLGILAYIFLIGSCLLISYFVFEVLIANKQIPLLMVFLSLFFAQFVYYQNSVLAFLFWLILGLLAVSWQKPTKEKKISFKDFAEMSLVFSSILIIVILGTAIVYFFAGKFYLADIKYHSTISGENVLEKLEEAVAYNPSQPQYKIMLARAYLNEVLNEAGKTEPAFQQLSLNVQRSITAAQSATEIAPNRVAAWETLGMIYRDIRGVFAGASQWGLTAFQRAIELEPTNPVLYTELGKIYLSEGKNEEAKINFLKASQLKPDYIDASVQNAFIYEGEGNLEEAIRQMEGLETSYPYDIDILFQLGRLYFNNNQSDNAIAKFERVVLLMPNHSNALYSLGAVYQKLGDINTAEIFYKRVLELNPDNEDIKAKLKELESESIESTPEEE